MSRNFASNGSLAWVFVPLVSIDQYALVQAAYIDQGSPSLLEALDACRDQQPGQVFVVPVYFPVDRTLNNWLVKVMRRWLHSQPSPSFTLMLAEAVGDSSELDVALVRLLNHCQQNPNVPLEAAGINPNSPGWSIIPPHDYHVLVCRGPRCNTAGAGVTAARLSQALKDKNLLDNGVLVAQTGCLFPCNLGPMMMVYPAGVWYCDLTEQAVEHIVEEHLVGGEIVQDYARYPKATAQQRPAEGTEA